MPYCRYMGQVIKSSRILTGLTLLILSTSCTSWLWPFGGGGGISDDPIFEATATYALALGGVAEGRDELVIYDENGDARDFTENDLSFSYDAEIVEISIRPNYHSFMEGSGVLLTPKKVGSTVVTYSVDGVEATETYLVIVPPQSLIQVMIGEARGQIDDEVTIEDGHVTLDSTSPTGEAIAAVVRNRVQLIEAGQPYSLFIVDEDDWLSNPDASYWDSVILANSDGVYQFSPVDPTNESNEVFGLAANRADVDDDELAAYDQSVLTVAGIFYNTTTDPTDGAFAFRTPTEDEADCLNDALVSGTDAIPSECGPGDENFPAFAPVQILIHPDVATLKDDWPSFVFYRSKNDGDPAVTNTP